MIKNKIGNVCDHLCAYYCNQCWIDECRAYTIPCSEQERIQREYGTAKCIGWGQRLSLLLPVRGS